MTLVRRVCCFGNALHGDDGVGPRVAEALRQRGWPGDVEVLDLGTDGLALSRWLADCTEAVLVDARRSDGPAGQVVVHHTGEAFAAKAGDGFGHGADLPFAVQAAQAELGVLPPMTVVTVTVAAIAMFRIGLSPAVEQAIPLAVVEIIRLLGEKETA